MKIRELSRILGDLSEEAKDREIFIRYHNERGIVHALSFVQAAWVNGNEAYSVSTVPCEGDIEEVRGNAKLT